MRALPSIAAARGERFEETAAPLACASDAWYPHG
jgi:hypothetical protein